VQREKVIKPPLIRSVSVGVNSRAPRRTNTLSWLCIFSPFVILGPLKPAQTCQEKSSRRKRLLIGAAALAVEGISVESAGRGQGACCQRPEPTGYHRDFLVIQITSSLADQHSVLVLHAYLLSLFWVRWSGPKLVKRSLPAAWRRKERQVAAEGEPP